jgi:hypothetical protein
MKGAILGFLISILLCYIPSCSAQSPLTVTSLYPSSGTKNVTVDVKTLYVTYNKEIMKKVDEFGFSLSYFTFNKYRPGSSTPIVSQVFFSTTNVSFSSLRTFLFSLTCPLTSRSYLNLYICKQSC